MKIEHLYKIAYTYYPKDISPFSIEFGNASETILLKQYMIDQRKKDKEIWISIQQKISEAIGVPVVDLTMMINDCPCFYCTFIYSTGQLLGKGHIWISLLIPSFIVDFYWFESGGLSAVDAETVRNKIISDTSKVVTSLVSIEPFPPDLQQKILPGVSLQHSRDGAASFREIFFTEYIGNF